MKWIDIKAGQPKLDEPVIFYDPTVDKVYYGWLVETGASKDDKVWYAPAGHNHIQYSRVSHWMQLPNPPRQ